MRKKYMIPSEALLKSIDRYFDCSLSDKEENDLRQTLATIDSDHPAILEAKALMGFQTIRRTERKNNGGLSFAPEPIRKNIALKICGFAAAAILIFAFGITIIYGGINNNDNECFAYVNGERITDEEIVMDILVENISELDRGAEDAHTLFIEDLNDLIPSDN